MAAARHSNQRITLVMLVLVSITVLTLDYHGEANRAFGHVRNGFSEAISPIQRGIQSVLHPFGDAVSAAFHYGTLEADNARLRAQNGALTRRLYSDRYAEQATDSLRALGNLSFVGSLETIPAQVVERSTSNFESTVEIGAGTDEGVGAGMPIVAEAGLIGTVVSASASTATVRLVDDTRSAIGVEDSSGHSYVLTGEGQDQSLQLKSGGAAAEPVHKSATLVTSGQSNGDPASIYPAGIPVGVVESTASEPGGVSTGTVRPLVNLATLDFVDVLEWAPSA